VTRRFIFRTTEPVICEEPMGQIYTFDI